MKKTLTLLALTTAALMPMMPLTANGGEDHFVQGITFQEAGNWNTATGWFDANKAWDVDGLQCWAATCSNMIAWWQTQNGYENVNLTSIWNEYRSTFVNDGGIIYEGVIWWLDGTGAGSENWQNHLKAGVTDPGGAHYTEYLDKGLVQRTGVDDIAIISSSVYDAAAFSKQLVAYIERGYCVGANFTKNSQGHAKTIWGVSCDDNGLITALYMSDSDDHARGTPDVAQIQIEPITTRYVNDTLRLALANSPNWSLESVVVLNSRLSNDTHYFNILDEESHNIILKQNVNGEGYTLEVETQEVKDIIFDGSRGTQDRLLTVEGEHAAETLYVNGSGSNTIDVTKGGQLVVEQITGEQNLTKTGEGALEIKGGTHTGSMDIQAGDVHNFGKLGDVTLANGGSLVNEGTTGELTVGKGSVAEIVRSAANSQDGAQAFTLCTVEEGGVLTGTGTFGEVVVEKGGTLKVGNAPELQVYEGNLSVYAANLVFSIDDAMSWRDNATEDKHGWGSYTYSTIDMNNKSLNLDNPEFTFVLGENILKRIAGKDLQTMVGQTFSTTKNLDIGLFLNMQNWNGFNPGDYTTKFVLSEELLAQGFTANIITNNLDYYMSGSDMYMQTGLNVTLAKAPAVPEPTTTTLSLLALASLCARRRRK